MVSQTDRHTDRCFRNWQQYKIIGFNSNTFIVILINENEWSCSDSERLKQRKQKSNSAFQEESFVKEPDCFWISPFVEGVTGEGGLWYRYHLVWY